jgi:hypothetical protein
MIPRRMGRIVNDDPALAVLWERTRPLRELQTLYATLVPPYLRAASRVGYVGADELKLFADSGAVATRIRLQVPDLLREFRARGWQFTAIRVGVQVRIPPGTHGKTPRPPLDQRAKSSLAKTAEAMHDSPLKDALARLARSGVRGKKTEESDL